MTSQRCAWHVLIAGLVMAVAGLAEAKSPLRVVTTLSTFADLVKQVGGDDVEVAYVASPRFNPHFIEPRPSDVVKVKRAALFVHAGLDLELWRWPLVDAAGNPAVRPGGTRELDLSRGIRLLEVPDRPVSRAEGDIHLYGNPHYWLDPANGRVMAGAICEKLCELEPTRCEKFRRNLAAFQRRLDGQAAQWWQRVEPIRGREAVAYHNEWPYLAAFAGFTVEQFLEPKPGIPPGPKQLGFLETYMKDRGIRVIIQTTFYPSASTQALARRTGASVAMLCQNVGERPETSDYLALLEYNVEQLRRAFGVAS